MLSNGPLMVQERTRTNKLSFKEGTKNFYGLFESLERKESRGG